MLGLLKLRKKGIMGLNRRNIEYVNELNPRHLMRLVNDKTETKRLADEAGIPTPALYGIISNYYEMRRLPEFLNQEGGLVIKPANGAQGNGILIVNKPLHDGWQLGNGRRASLEDIKFHVNNISSGMHSLGGQPDKAMLEYRVKFDDVFDAISFKGVPDIRLIVIRGIPIAGMLRLPTAQSDGKANLHKGGVGVGLDLMTGETRGGMCNGRIVDLHPDTAQPLVGVKVPHWTKMLEMASQSYGVTGLGYLGADIVLDKDRGPLLLELNARPGISIQIANEAGLAPTMKAALTADTTDMTTDDLIEVGCQLQEKFML